MSTVIGDGSGGGAEAKVNANNRLYTNSLILDESLSATHLGNSFNINTGDVTLTDGTESAVLYFKNNDEPTIIVEAIAIGIGTLGGTVSESTKITMVRNPTGGTIVSNATNVDMNQNRNFASSKILDNSLAYKGTQGYTLTGGSDIAQFYMTGGQRMFAGINFQLDKGDSVGLKIDLNDTTGGVLYAALVVFQVDSNE